MPPAYEVLLLNTAIPQIQAAQSGDTYVVPRDIAFSAALTLSAGTANGVPYLNGSKVVTTGTALTFDGTNLGIGTTSPAGKLSVNVDAATQLITFRDSSGRQIWAHEPGGNARPLTIKAQSLTYADDSATRLTVDTSGNLGLGVTPSAWNSAYKAFQFGTTGALHGESGDAAVYLACNAFINSAGLSKYITTDFASRYNQENGVHKWLIAASGTAGDTISFTQAMTLLANGNFGIGTTNPDEKLVVSSTSAAGYATSCFDNTATNGYSRIQFRIGATGGSGLAEVSYAPGIFFAIGPTSNDTTTPIVFRTNNSTERARITSGGDFLVGTTDSTLGATNGVVIGPVESGWTVSNSGNVPIRIYNKGTSGTRFCMEFRNASSAVGTITHDGTNTAYNTSSDYRLKDNPQPLTGSGAFIDALKPKTWDWKSDGTKGVGFIAHEVQEVSPKSVVGEKDATEEEQYEVTPAVPATYDEDGNELTAAIPAVMGTRTVPKYQAMEYGSAEFIANIVAELQSLRARVKALEGA